VQRYVYLPSANICESRSLLARPHFQLSDDFKAWIKERFGGTGLYIILDNSERVSVTFSAKVIRNLGKARFRSLLLEMKIRWG